MRRHAARALSAGAAGLAVLAGSILWAVPAEACSCASQDMDMALAAGRAVAIVTRTDAGPADGGTGDGGGFPVATFRVEDSIGPAVPATLHGEMDTGASCQPYVAPGAVAALIYERKDGAWHLGSCADVELGKALQRAQGDPVAVEGGPTVAYAAGGYGGSRLAALDGAGRVVAWDKTPGYGDLVATCPDGRTVVTVGRTPAADYAYRLAELTVHDATTLQVLRTVRLGTTASERPVAVHCSDPRGERVSILVVDGNADYLADLLTVRGGKVDRLPVGHGAYATTTEDGFVVLDGERSKQVSVASIRPDGRRATIAALPDLNGADGLAVSRDGRTVAVFGNRSGRAKGDGVLTIDVKSGKRLGEFTRDHLYASGMAWTTSGTLLLRDQQAYRPRSTPVLAFDRTLTQQDKWPSVADEWAGRFTAVGEAAVVFGNGSRLAATPRSGPPLVAGSLRLAAAEHLVAVGDGEFAADGATPPRPAPTSVESTVADQPDQPSTDARLLGIVGGASAAAAAGLVVLRRRASH